MRRRREWKVSHDIMEQGQCVSRFHQRRVRPVDFKEQPSLPVISGCRNYASILAQHWTTDDTGNDRDARQVVRRIDGPYHVGRWEAREVSLFAFVVFFPSRTTRQRYG